MRENGVRFRALRQNALLRLCMTESLPPQTSGQEPLGDLGVADSSAAFLFFTLGLLKNEFCNNDRVS